MTVMTSEAKVASCRRNARKSTGPKTPEGRERSSQNAHKHGLWSKRAALARDEVERLRFRYDLHRRCELATQWLGGAQVRDREPGLRPSVAAGLYCPDDHQVDPRRVMAECKP